MQETRKFSGLDKCIITAQRILETFANSRQPIDISHPQEEGKEHASHKQKKTQHLSPDDSKIAAGLMRVNHAGEVAAQGLYHGHALVAALHNDVSTYETMLQFSKEESLHLTLCENRILALGSQVSIFQAFWYWGAVSIGCIVAIRGVQVNYAFIEETEKQVTIHLEEHLRKLPEKDLESREVLKRIREDEMHHAQEAGQNHSLSLPLYIKKLMTLTSGFMKVVAYRL